MKLLLLHALPLDERMWDAHGLEAVRPRLYGRGNTMEQWARSILDEVEGDVVAVGASLGGYCALAMAAVAPDRLRGLILAGSRADADTPERRAGRADTIAVIRERGADGLWEQMRPKLFPEDVDDSVVERARAIALEQSPEELVQAVEAIRDRLDSTEVFRALDCPTLVALGDQDPFVPVEDARALVGLARDGELHVFQGTGHLPSLQRPAEFNDVLRRLLARV